MARKVLKLIVFFTTIFFVKTSSNILCYYDSRSSFRDEAGVMNISHLEPALRHCTHLIYGYAKINPDTFTIEQLNTRLDITLQNYHAVTQLKHKYPEMKVLLSVGGDADEFFQEKYVNMLESPERRNNLVQKAVLYLKSYGFDGLDLAWQFPTIPPKIIRGTFSRVWNGIKNWVISKDTTIDKKETEHRDQFTSLLSSFNTAFRPYNLVVTISVLPNVNSTAYFDIPAIKNYVNLVNLMAFDYHTPKRNPKEADYASPLYEIIDRRPDENGDALVSHWLQAGIPSYKLIYGIPAFARTWKITSGSSNGVPPLGADGPGQEGPQTQERGLLSYPEVCLMLKKKNRLENFMDSRITINEIYGFRAPDYYEEGIWVAYDHMTSIGNKVKYVKEKRLGGVALHDLSLDDFKGVCTGAQYPILHGIKGGLLTSS